MLKISKENSTVIKGIVIMMMVFYHVFHSKYMSLYTGWLYVGKIPLATWLSSACYPVNFFLILSGYGLAYKYSHGDIKPRNQLRRIFRLYLHYWVVLALFLTIGHFMVPERYPGNFDKLVANMLGWESSYNGEMWFLFPYAVLSLFSYYIIHLTAKTGNLIAIVITTGIYACTSYLISRYGSFLQHNMYAYQPLLCLHLLLAFIIGVALQRTRLPLSKPIPQWAVLAIIITLLVVAFTIHSSIIYMTYIVLMTIMLSHIQWPRWLKAILAELGRKSMPIWMIHTWLAYYLFQPQVYALRYPVFIFFGVLIASYLISIPVMWIAGKLYDLLPTKS